ncbi:glycosyltransferase [Pseudomonas kuykendallii]|uniref:Glycosyltransferase involved in cell wall bisynthesis n=1 Tax=Pseudomonas kuykendallii TaxID=1007099 RepID=A0A1H2VXT1_9PSED|nr:glycosyltransferase family 2 protein [Pseudomonas kuykendallii]MCQ4272936.1 glycosyltransferase [Pseudomonas kuykendallii]SDW73158.1 Glycosyltransferase involved in cell wall bisynthesis [Pseudomonas kuykendallii]
MQVADARWKRDAPADLLLSVIIPAYNYASVLSRCLDSVLMQLTGECELIVVDDGSQDTTLDLLRGRHCGAQRAAYLRQDNRGPSAARNAGLAISSGRWVLFLDADDVMASGAIAAILHRLRTCPGIDLLLGGHLDCAEDGSSRYHPPGRIADAVFSRLDDFLLKKRFGMGHGSAVFRRARATCCPYPEDLKQGEDLAVFAFMLSSPVISVLDVPLVWIYKHADSLRNQLELDAAHGDRVAAAVFERLPGEFQHRLRAYRAQRQLSLFRGCYLAGLRSEALACYRRAWRLDPWIACRWDYLSKWLRLVIGWRGTRL